MKKTYLILVILGFIVLLTAFSFTKNQQPVVKEVSSFEECKNAGYPIMETYPEQCRTPNGQVFVNEIKKEEKPTASSIDFGKPQVFKVNSKVTFSDGLEVTLKEINDSRCKPDVQCIWAGELSALFSISGGSIGAVSKEVRLGTTNNQTFNLNEYSFTLKSATESEVTVTLTFNKI